MKLVDKSKLDCKFGTESTTKAFHLGFFAALNVHFFLTRVIAIFSFDYFWTPMFSFVILKDLSSQLPLQVKSKQQT